MTGRQLFETLVLASGLPKERISYEVELLLKKSNKTIEDLTIDDLRNVLSDYLQDVLIEAKESFKRESA